MAEMFSGEAMLGRLVCDPPRREAKPDPGTPKLVLNELWAL